MTKQTSSRVSSMASRIQTVAKRGGPLVVHREAMLLAMEQSLRQPKHYPVAVTDDQRRLDAIQGVLQPYIDAAESCAASALGQDETKGQASG